jgi:tRNA U34 5-carboxymethylaminomethyl modifying GTPase MnmE/TrmE
MLKPRSYTREDVVELHCHGGSICVQRVLSLCLVRCGKAAVRLGCRLTRASGSALARVLRSRASSRCEPS